LGNKRKRTAARSIYCKLARPREFILYTPTSSAKVVREILYVQILIELAAKARLADGQEKGKG
jgi:hypothetical protein